ncbi:MAG TPA: SdrD B-like domain-containing protein, partial [Humisphaera sp.]|nr:SdrD B-like domain-containing protein [Humisphaera sp.]
NGSVLFFAGTSPNLAHVKLWKWTPITATAGGPYSVFEGSTVDLHATATPDIASAIASYEWDGNFDGKTFTTDATGIDTNLDAASLYGPATRTIALRVTDSSGNIVIVTTPLAIIDEPPTATFTGQEALPGSGGIVTFADSLDPHPSPGTVVSFLYSYDFDNDGQYELTNVNTPTAAVPASFLSGLGQHVIHGRITDQDGVSSEYTTTIDVVLPVSESGLVFGDVNANGLLDANEAGVGQIPVFLDRNNDGAYEADEPTTVTGLDGAYEFAQLLPGSYMPRVRLSPGWTETDDLGDFQLILAAGSTVSDLELGVQGPPVPKIGGPYSVGEGSSVTLNATGSSEIGGTITKFEWDTNYNGTTFVARATGVSTSFSAVGLDGPGSRVIALRVTDANGITATATGTVTINNAPPKATFAAGSPVTLGSAGSISFSAASDPSPADVTAGFKYSYDFDNNGTFETANSTSTTATVPASYLATTGAHTIHGRIIDKDGGFSDYTTTIQVNAASSGASISGLVYNDANGNGIRDSGEAVISGQKFFIDKNVNSILDAGEPTFTTGAAGTFTFSGLAAGTYRIREVTMSGWRWTNPTSGYYNATVTANQVVTGKNFGETTNALISGIVFKDTNANAKQDTGEVALSGWVVYLDTNNNGILDTGEKSFTTGTDGKFSFVVPAGTYHLREVLKSGFAITTPAGGLYTLTLASGQSATGKNFGDK